MNDTSTHTQNLRVQWACARQMKEGQARGLERKHEDYTENSPNWNETKGTTDYSRPECSRSAPLITTALLVSTYILKVTSRPA